MRTAVVRWLIGGGALALLVALYTHLAEDVPWIGATVGGLFFASLSVVFGETFLRRRVPRRKG